MAEPLTVEVFQCRGSSYEVGRALAEGYRRAGKPLVCAPEQAPRIADFDLENARTALLDFAPNLWEELRGIADGLSLPFEEAVRAFSNGSLAYPRRGCSALMTKRCYGRNYDFGPSRYDHALVAVQPDDGFAHIGFTDGLTGRLDGMNELGLVAGLHYVNESACRPGLGATLIVRILLDQCASTAEAIELLRRLPHGLAFSYSLLDRHGAAAVVEVAPDGISVHEGAPLACTNHFRAPELQPANGRESDSSERRLPPLEAWARAGLPAEELFGLLNEPRSPAFHHDYAGFFGTLHTIVCEPEALRMTVGVGGGAEPCSFDLGAWMDGSAFETERLEGVIEPLGARDFVGRDLAGARFRKVSLRGARFDEVDFAGVEIGESCNFAGMTIAGVSVAKLVETYRKQKAGQKAEDRARVSPPGLRRSP